MSGRYHRHTARRRSTAHVTERARHEAQQKIESHRRLFPGAGRRGEPAPFDPHNLTQSSRFLERQRPMCARCAHIYTRTHTHSFMHREELSFELPRLELAAGPRTGAVFPDTPCGREITLSDRDAGEKE